MLIRVKIRAIRVKKRKKIRVIRVKIRAIRVKKIKKIRLKNKI